jgi:FAD binding domain-containing protein/D-arabinono-1,4-lactone oxidase
MSDTHARKEWSNCIGNQKAFPLNIFRPTTLVEVVAIVKRAESENRKVRAVGSGHSFSDIALTDDFLIDTHGLKKVLRLDTETLKAGVQTSTLVEVECGITIADVNDRLDEMGLALINMGAHTAQTVVGALSTSTHGSGIGLGSAASFVRSIVVVGSEGTVYRIEPADGITDPGKFKSKHGDMELRHDDDWFKSVVIGLGCMGVVYSVTIAVREKYWLRETRTLSKWGQVKADLLKGEVLRENRHYEVLVSPYKLNGDHTCLVTARSETPEPRHPSPEKDNRSPLSVGFSFLPRPLIRLFGKLESLKLRLLPGSAPRTIENSLKALVDEEYIAKSYRVLDLGAPNYVAGYSSELALDVADHSYIAAAEKIIEIAGRNRNTKKIYHTVPFSLRFVAKHDLYLSMMYGRDTCMIEVPMIDPTNGGMEILRDIEEGLLELGARPHWGQVNYLPGGISLIRKMYPMLDKWLAVRRTLNSRGTFNNNFSQRCGFD